MNLRRVAAGLALAGAMTMTMTPGAGAAQAAAEQAVPGTAYILIHPKGNGYMVYVSGNAPSGRRGSVSVSLLGDDGETYEHLYGPVSGTSDYDGAYDIGFYVKRGVLDEDPGQDEVYARVVFPQLISLETRTVKGHF